MDNEFEQFIADAGQPFSGWDFSYIARTGREVESPLPWSYTSQLLPHMWQAESMLDMGTGGGEFLARLRPLPADTAATEGYPPNVAVARGRLEPLGVRVHEVTGDLALPFEDGRFGLVINRHESYSPAEVWRVLQPGGYFITQQVGGDNDNELNHLLGAPPMTAYKHWTLQFAVNELEAAGFEILMSQEAEMFTRLYDVGAVVYYLKAVPWQIEEFSVERYREGLLDLHQRIRSDGFLDIPGQRFMIKARRLP